MKKALIIHIFKMEETKMPGKKKSNAKPLSSDLIPLCREEALEGMKAGERLVDGINNYGIAHYHWHDGYVLQSDSYYDLYGEGVIIPENDLPQLYRMGPEGNFANNIDKEYYWKRKKKNSSHNKIMLELDNKNYHYVLQQYGPEGAKTQAISMCLAAGRPITRENLEGLLTNLEEALEENFIGGVDELQ